MMPDAPDDAAVRQIAAAASVDVRTVIRRLAGLPVRGLAGSRVDAAIAQWRGQGARYEAGAPVGVLK